MSSTDSVTQFSSRALSWRLRTQTLEFDRRPRLMGILNVTPDSFSDGGRFFEHEQAIDRGLAMAAEGADILDVGGESTRPYSESVPDAEQMRRVIPVIEALCQQTGVPISIDTASAEVAREAVAAGAEIINDVTGLTGDPEMLAVAVDSRAGVCAMHMQGTPQTMQNDPRYDDVVEDIFQYLSDRLNMFRAAGVDRERICLDPGIGFGKTHEHNLTLMAECGRYHDLGQPVLVGHSRKAFIGKVLGDKEADRTAGTIGAAMTLALQGIQVIRVHDVLLVRQALTLFEATGGLSRMQPT